MFLTPAFYLKLLNLRVSFTTKLSPGTLIFSLCNVRISKEQQKCYDRTVGCKRRKTRGWFLLMFWFVKVAVPEQKLIVHVEICPILILLYVLGSGIWAVYQEAHKGFVSRHVSHSSPCLWAGHRKQCMVGYRVDHERGGYVRWLNSWIVLVRQIRWISLELAFLWRANKAQRKSADLNLIGLENQKQSCLPDIIWYTCFVRHGMKWL